MSTNLKTISDLAEREYKWGFVTELEEDRGRGEVEQNAGGQEPGGRGAAAVVSR